MRHVLSRLRLPRFLARRVHLLHHRNLKNLGKGARFSLDLEVHWVRVSKNYRYDINEKRPSEAAKLG